MFFNCCRKQKNNRKLCPLEYLFKLKQTTNLSSGQIQHLYERFYFIADVEENKIPQHIHKRKFLCIGNLRRNPLLTVIMNSMFKDKKVLDFIDFATYLSIFQAPAMNTKADQLQYVAKKKLHLLFKMYDVNNDGRITEDDLIKIVHKLFADFMQEEDILNIVGIMMSEMDTSNTDQILFDDFCIALAVFDMDSALIMKIPETK